MTRRRKAKWLSFLTISGAALVGLTIFFGQKPNQEESVQLRLKRNLEQRVKISESLEEAMARLQMPQSLEIDIDENGKKQTLTPKYTLDEDLQKEADNLLKRYRPDYGAVFMMDAKTGRVLAFSSYQKNPDNMMNHVTRAGSPSASVFKIVTATAAVDGAGLSPSHTIRFNGGNYTLYKKNVMSDRITRWTRTITLRDAFAHSYNTAFGRLSLKDLKPEDINEYATRYMFNQAIPSDFPVESGTAFVPTERSFELTEVASGYNRMNRMSPVQGAMIAAAVINDGKMVMPYLIDNLTDANGKEVYRGEPVDNGTIMSAASAAKIRELMEETVISGTSRKSFRPLIRNRRFREVSIGGKTGHLTGENPRGRVDWFVGYASDDDRKISIAALTISKEFWTVKSSHLAQVLFHKSFRDLQANSINKYRGVSSSR